jgi:hypothetical protein
MASVLAYIKKGLKLYLFFEGQGVYKPSSCHPEKKRQTQTYETTFFLYSSYWLRHFNTTLLQRQKIYHGVYMDVNISLYYLFNDRNIYPRILKVSPKKAISNSKLAICLFHYVVCRSNYIYFKK